MSITEQEGMWPVVQYGVQVGTWPPYEYQSRDLAEFYAANPFAAYKEYPHSVVTRTVLYGNWEPCTPEVKP